jgi:hypothetical protein
MDDLEGRICGSEGKLVTNIRDASPSVLAAEIIEALNEGLYEQGEFFEEYGIEAEWSTAQEFLTEVVMALNPQHGKLEGS